MKKNMYKERLEPELVKIANFDIKMYKKPEPNHCYTIGGDVGDGIGRDYSVITIYDITNPLRIEQVCTFNNNKVDAPTFAYIIAKLGVMYNKAPILLECNDIGKSAIDFLHTIYEYENIVNYGSKGMGIYSCNKSKTEACLHFKYILECKDIEIIVHEELLLKELEYFEKTEGRGLSTFRASKTNNDDQVMSNVWALFLLKQELLDYTYDVKWTTLNETFIYPIKIRNFNSSYYGNSQEDNKKELHYLDKAYKDISSYKKNGMDAIKDLHETNRNPKSLESSEDEITKNLGFFDF
jgi:hypothetical protein